MQLLFLLVDLTFSDPPFEKLEVLLMDHLIIFALHQKNDYFQMRYFMPASAAGTKERNLDFGTC